MEEDYNKQHLVGQSNQLKQSILIAKDYFFEFFRKWYVYLLFLLIFCSLAFWYHGKKVITYEGRASLMTASDTDGGMSGLMQLAGQFGMAKQSQVSSEKLVELLGTKRIIYTTLFQTVTLDNPSDAEKGKTDLLVNLYLDYFKIDETLSKATGVERFRYTKKPIEELNYNESLILNNIYSQIKQSHLNAFTTKNGIIHVLTECKSESFSKYFTENIVQVLKNFYIDKTIEKQKQTYSILTSRTDSIKNELEGADAMLTQWYDAKQKQLRANSLSAKDYMNKITYERKAEIASAAYIESLKQKEMAKISLDSSTPIIQIVDFPSFPLKEIRPSFFIYLLAAIFAALILSSILIILWKLVRDALA